MDLGETLKSIRAQGQAFESHSLQTEVLILQATWPTQVALRGNPTQSRPESRPESTRYGPDRTTVLTTVDWWLTGGPAVVRSGGGSGDGKVERPRGTTQVVTRGTTNDWVSDFFVQDLAISIPNLGVGCGVWVRDGFELKRWPAVKSLSVAANKIEKISIEDARFLEKSFDEKEVWEAIRGCEGDKASRPDVEGLNAIVNEAVEKGIFRGVVVGDDNITVSHLRYTDDTIFFGEWNKANAKSLMCILKCFEEVSGLRVNYNKSKIYGIGVNEDDILDMARWMGCDVGEFSFAYLGLPIGENMRRVNAWNPVGNGRRDKGGGVWCDIAKNGVEINGLGVDFSSSYVGVVGDGRDIRSVRGGVTKEFEDLLTIVGIDGGGHLVKTASLRSKSYLEALKGRLPVKVELDRRGIDLNSILYPSYNNIGETCAHSLITCDIATSAWDKTFSWWKVGTVNAFSIDEFFSSNGNVNVPIYFLEFGKR
ncbi:hypothetical protein Tco_0173541 [Tanacetum coccineum]